MPRRLVGPETRLRTAQACDTCKSAKKRCDGNQPCNTCWRKGLSSSCRYATARRRHRRRLPLPHVQQQQQEPEEYHVPPSEVILPVAAPWDVANAGSRPSAAVALNRPIELHRSSQDSPIGNGEDGAGSPNKELEEAAFMLSSMSGEKVFVGGTAAIPFLRFLQTTLKRHAGPSGFTDGQDSDNWFELSSLEATEGQFKDDLSIEVKKHLVNFFLDASSGLLDLHTKDEINHLVQSCVEESQGKGAAPSSSSQKWAKANVASLYLMIAIGARCRGTGPEDFATAEKYFTHARKISFEGLLQNPTLDLIRSFLLMAFYMCCACRRNPAFMYLGVASKAADILGLHVSTQRKYLPPEVQDARLRTAKSLRVFDVVCNSILGRASTTASSLKPGVKIPTTAPPAAVVTAVAPSPRAPGLPGLGAAPDTDTDTTSYRVLALDATHALSQAVNAAVADSAEEGCLDIASAESFLDMFRNRSRASIASLSGWSASRSRGVLIGNLHVAGAYYFGTILATRHFLKQHVMPQLRGEPLGSEANTPQGLADRSVVADLSHACVEAARYMSQLCQQVMDAGALLGNMCIIQAWIFATGLVLGFSLLANDCDNEDNSGAFHGSLRVLSKIKRLSPQAEQYYGILVDFSDAIRAYKEQQRPPGASRRRLVERLFPPSPPQGSSGGGGEWPVGNQRGGSSTQMSTMEEGGVDEGLWLGPGGGVVVPPHHLSHAQAQAQAQAMTQLDWGRPGEDDVMMRLIWDECSFADLAEMPIGDI
ncbi:hypothetical protein BX600DRAFT_506210 [Xylariales sp. PMI_506]|nr:hypothetical protein BX600DRAFT_506210 [Xylariales sp. PMI_506]